MPGPDQRSGCSPALQWRWTRTAGIELYAAYRRTTHRNISNEFRRSLLKTGDLHVHSRDMSGRLALVPPELDGAKYHTDTARLAIRGAGQALCAMFYGHRQFSAVDIYTQKGLPFQESISATILARCRYHSSTPPQREFAAQISAVERLRNYLAGILAAKLDALFASSAPRLPEN